MFVKCAFLHGAFRSQYRVSLGDVVLDEPSGGYRVLAHVEKLTNSVVGGGDRFGHPRVLPVLPRLAATSDEPIGRAHVAKGIRPIVGSSYSDHAARLRSGSLSQYRSEIELQIDAKSPRRAKNIAAEAQGSEVDA
jgi:hypothetical protein